jgi:hypothetical protein
LLLFHTGQHYDAEMSAVFIGRAVDGHGVRQTTRVLRTIPVLLDF